MDPGFINASSISILQRLRDAQQRFAPEGRGCRFYIYSPWIIHPDDEMAGLVEQTDGRIRWSVLSEGGARSKMGEVRTAWREHLRLGSDEELRLVLAPVRIIKGPNLDGLSEQLNLRLQLAGLRPVQEGTIINQYDDLARKFIERGRSCFTRREIEEICKKEGLWYGRVVAETDTMHLGIRSFWLFAENLEDETDETLCLLHHFNGRYPKDPSLWGKAIVPEVTRFLRKATPTSRPYSIQLQTHGTIAFLAGWELPPKSGVNIVPIQYSSTGRYVWKSENITPEIERKYPTWGVSSTQLESSKGVDTVLTISATHDIERDVSVFARQNIETARRLFNFRLPIIGPTSIIDGTHAQLLAQSLVSTVMEIQRDQNNTGVLHIFFAAPNGLLFMIGRLSHVLGRLVLYEHDFERGGDSYSPSISFPTEYSSDPDASSEHRENRK